MNNILYIVVPCYNEEAVLYETTLRLTRIIDALIEKSVISQHSRILYINDGSNDNTWQIIEKLHTSNKYIAGINLACNVGHQFALLAGLHTVKAYCDFAISIDADLQDDVEIIPQMVQKHQEGFDIVYGVRNERKSDTIFKRTTAQTFYKLMNGLGVKTVYNHADFRLMSKRALYQLSNYKERNVFLRGIVPLIGYQSTIVFYERHERFAGESKYPVRKMINFAIEGITSLSIKPVRLIFTTGVIFLIIAFLVLIYTVYSYITHSVVPGWSSVILSIWFVGGVILMSLGIIGEYIGKIYLETKERPLYNIETLLLDNGKNTN